MTDLTKYLSEFEAALKSDGVVFPSDLGKSILAPEQLASFVRAMEHKTTILPEARYSEMQAQVQHIDRVGFIGRILKAGGAIDPMTQEQWHDKGAQEHRVLEDTEYVKPQTYTNVLVARELMTVVSISDKAMRRNIERGDFEATILDMMGSASGRDLEEYGLLADTSIAYADDDVLSLTDGWLKLAARKVYGADAGKDFDPADDEFPENMFDAALEAMPKQYLTDRSMFRFYVPWDVENAYRDLLRARGTVLGDQAQTTNQPIPYKGIPVVYCPMLERSKAYDAGKNYPGKVALLSHPENMVWGVFHQVTIESERVAKARRTDFVLSFEGAVGYEDENGAVAMFIDRPKS